MKNTQIKIGGIINSGMGYIYENKNYKSFKSGNGVDIITLDYFNLGEKYFWNWFNEAPYQDGTFEMYDTIEEAMNSKEAKFYLEQGYALKKDTIYRIICYGKNNFHQIGTGEWVITDHFDDYDSPACLLTNFLPKTVAQDIIQDNGIKFEGEDYGVIVYHYVEPTYSIVVSYKGYTITAETNIPKDMIEDMLKDVKGNVAFDVVEGAQIDGKLVGKIWEE